MGGFRRSGLPLRFGLPLGELAFGLTASAFRHAPLRSGRWASWPSGSQLPLFGTRRFGVAAGRVRSSAFRFGVAVRRVGLRVHCFRFSARAVSEIALGGLVFGLTASAFRHALIRSGCWASSFFRLPLRKLPSAGWPSGSLLSLFGTHRFGDSARRIGSSAFRFGVALGELAFGFAASAFRHAPLRRLPLGELAFGLTASAFRHAPLRRLPLGGLAFGLTTSAFGTHRSAPPHRRREGRRSAPTRHLFHFKTLIPTC